MSFLTPNNIRSACGGSWLARSARDDVPCTGVGIDSRAVTEGQVFVAIRGETHDGHVYVADAIAAGARLAVIDDDKAVGDVAGVAGEHNAHVLKVADARKALLRLAAAYRKTFQRTRVIAVTGSAGKTTTVRLIDALLASSLRGRASVKSFNNDIGVPLTLLSADPGDQYLVCEVGTNSPGEIGRLAAIIEPDVAVITCIGRAHLEGLGSVEGVAREKASLYSHLKPNGLAVAPADAPDLADALKCVPQVVTFGRSEQADLRLSSFTHVARTDGARSSFTVNDRAEFESALIGEHNALNAMAAIAVARRFSVEETAIQSALTNFTSPEMRLQRLDTGDVSILNDAYNANPESMIAALRALSNMESRGRRIAILGDMLELGDHSAAAHRDVAEAVLDLGNIDLVVAVGHGMLEAAERLTREWPTERCLVVSDLTPEQTGRIAGLVTAGDTVLVKGSRRMRLERVVEAICALPMRRARRKAAATA